MVEDGPDDILGATIVTWHAGDMISEIHKLGDAYNRTGLTPFAKSALGARLDWSR